MTIEQITDKHFIRQTYYNSADSSSSCRKMAGVDNVIPQAFKLDLPNQIALIQEELRSGTYRHQALRHHIIPRGNQEAGRVIATPTQKDKLVQRLLCFYLTHEIYTPIDRLGIATDISYGLGKDFTPTAQEAVKDVARVRRTKRYGVKTDIANFYNEIDRSMIMGRLSARIDDSRILSILEQVVYADIRGEASLARNTGIITGRGLRQGSPLSPILASALLSDFDNAINQRWFNAYRVADDIICLCSTLEQARRIKAIIETNLQRLALTISPLQQDGGKTRIFSSDESVRFLGIDICPSPTNDKYLKRIPATTIDTVAEKVEAIFSPTRGKYRAKPLPQRTMAYDSTIAGYKGYFGQCSNYNGLTFRMRNLRDRKINELVISKYGNNPFEAFNAEQKHFIGLPA